MTKAEIRAIADKYNMEIVRHPITQEAHAVKVTSESPIPELDRYALTNDPAQLPCGFRRWDSDGHYNYIVEVPTSWFDLWGWR